MNGSSVITDARLYWLRCHKARQGTAYRAQSSSNGRFDVVAASAKTRSTNRQCTKRKGRGQPPRAGRACWRLPLELAEELPTLSALYIVHTFVAAVGHSQDTWCSHYIFFSYQRTSTPDRFHHVKWTRSFGGGACIKRIVTQFISANVPLVQLVMINVAVCK